MLMTVERQSAVAVYVLADDGMLYRDPLVCGDGWQLLFPPDDAPALLLADALLPVGRDPSIFAGRFLDGLLRQSSEIVSACHHKYAPTPHWRFALALSQPPPARLFGGDGALQPQRPAFVFSFGRRWG